METDILTVLDPAGAVAGPEQPRTRGGLRVTSRRRGAHSVIGDLHQSGALRLLFPGRAGPWLDAVFLNTAGGVTGGDRLTYEAEAGPGAKLRLSSQAAERLYRAQPGESGRIDVRLSAGPGGRVDWLPQETILYDRAHVARRIDVDLAADAACLLVEPLILGRFGMGERVHSGHLTDQWRVRRDGRLVFADALRLAGPIDRIAAVPSVLDGAGAAASLLFCAPVADSLLGPVRDLLEDTDAQAGASVVRPGVLFVRIVAQDGFALRKVLIPLVTLVHGQAVPRPWML